MQKPVKLTKRYIPLFQAYRYVIESKDGKLLAILIAENRDEAEAVYEAICAKV